MPKQSVSIELTPDGYTVSCIGTHVTGRGHTEAAAWNDFWITYHAQWKPPTVTSSNGLPPALKRRRIRTLRVRDLFG